MTKANLEIDFGNLSPDEIPNALALVAAALRGAFVPRNSVTGAIEITEGPDAVQPTATLGSPDAFWSAAFIDSLNIGGREITADTLLPVTPLVFTRPADATEDQTPSIIWPWPHSQETAARIRVVSPQAGGHGGAGGSWVGPSTNVFGAAMDPDSLRNNPNSQGFFTAIEFYVYGLSFGDQFLFSYGRGGVGGTGGAPNFAVLPQNHLQTPTPGTGGGAPAGYTAIRVPSSKPLWRVVGRNYSGARHNRESGRTLEYVFKGGVAVYELDDAPLAAVTAFANGQRFFEELDSTIRVPNISGREGQAGTNFSSSATTPTTGHPGEPGHDGFIIIEPFRGIT